MEFMPDDFRPYYTALRLLNSSWQGYAYFFNKTGECVTTPPNVRHYILKWLEENMRR